MVYTIYSVCFCRFVDRIRSICLFFSHAKKISHAMKKHENLNNEVSKNLEN